MIGACHHSANQKACTFLESIGKDSRNLETLEGHFCDFSVLEIAVDKQGLYFKAVTSCFYLGYDRKMADCSKIAEIVLKCLTKREKLNKEMFTQLR